MMVPGVQEYPRGWCGTYSQLGECARWECARAAKNVGHLPEIREKTPRISPLRKYVKIQKNMITNSVSTRTMAELRGLANNRASEATDDPAYGHVPTHTESYESPKRRNSDKLENSEFYF